LTLALPSSTSVLVRRLLFRCHENSARPRTLASLLAVDDARLLKFGLSPEDIAILRTSARGQED